MTEEVFNNIVNVLQGYYGFDALDIVEFVLQYERVSSESIPDEWTNKL